MKECEIDHRGLPLNYAYVKLEGGGELGLLCKIVKRVLRKRETKLCFSKEMKEKTSGWPLLKTEYKEKFLQPGSSRWMKYQFGILEDDPKVY